MKTHVLERVPAAPMAGDLVELGEDVNLEVEATKPGIVVDRVTGWVWPLGIPAPLYFEVAIVGDPTIRLRLTERLPELERTWRGYLPEVRR